MDTATAAPVAEPAAQTYTCDVCGETFSSSRAMGGHKSAKHRTSAAPGAREYRKAKSKPKAVDVIANAHKAQIDADTAELITKWTAQRVALVADIDAKERELNELRETRNYLDVKLRKLGAEPPPVRPRSDAQRAQTASLQSSKDITKRDYIVAMLGERPGESLTGAQLSEIVRERNWQPKLSPEKARVLLRQLHEQGIVRADKVVRGGGMAYMVINPNGAQPHGETTT